jgi:hypothetical protein
VISVETFVGMRLRCCAPSCRDERVFNAPNFPALRELIQAWSWKLVDRDRDGCALDPKQRKAYCPEHHVTEEP